MEKKQVKKNWYRYLIQLIVVALIVTSIPLNGLAETARPFTPSPNSEKNPQEKKNVGSESPTPHLDQLEQDKSKPTEVVEERTEHEKVFDNKDGTYTKKVYTEPIHTEKNGKLEDIQPELVAKTQETIESKTTKLQPTFQKKLEEKEYATFEVDGHKVTYQLIGAKGEKGELQPSPTTATYDKNEIWYKSIFPQIDLRTITFNDKVKEDVVLHQYTGHHSFKFQLQTDLTPKLEQDGSIVMMDEQQKQVFILPKPFMTDSNVHPESNEAPKSEEVHYTLEKQENNSYQVTVTADPKWLQDPARKYPVYIDPSIAMGSFQEAYVSSAQPKSNYSRWVLWDEGQKAHTLKFGYFDNQTGYNFIYTKPEISSLKGAVVHDAKFRLYASWHYYGNNPNEVWLDEVKGDWDYISMNWETKPWSQEIGVTKVGRQQWAEFNVTNTVKAWASGERPNYGFKLHPNGQGQTHWKKFIAAYQGGYYAPHLEITYSYPKPNKPRVTSHSNGIGSGTGHLSINWDTVPGATGYRVGIFDGEDYNYYKVGNITSWSTKDKKIWPSRDALNQGRNELHFDGQGGELPTSPLQMYQNNGDKEQGNDKHAYKIKVVAEYPHDELSPESDEEKVFLPLETSKQPQSHTFTNVMGSKSGYIELNWDQIPGATGYRVIFYNGKSHEVFDVGNTTNWSTQGKKIYPTAEELKQGRYQFHTDGKGEELALNPSPVYQNAGTFSSDKYWVHIQSYSNIGHRDSGYSPDYGIKIAEPTDIFGLKDYIASVDVIAGKVNATNGNFVVNESDFVLSGRGPDLRIDRVYNSNSTEKGVLGTGWTSSFDENIQEQSNGDLHLIHEDRAVDRFEKEGDNKYKAPPGVFLEIKKTNDGYTITDKDQTVSEYNKQGRLTKVKDEHGNTLTYRYENNRLLEIINASNRKLALEYNTEGFLSKITGPENRTVTYEYKDGQLIGVTTPRGKKYRYGYENGKLRYTYDPKHTEQKPYKTTYTYENNRFVSVTDPLGKATKLAYKPETREVIVTDPKQVKDVYQHNFAGNPEKTIVDADGLKLTTTYEYEGNKLIKKTDPKDQGKRASESYTYDSKGNVTSATDAIGTEKYEYNQNNDVTKEIDTENKEIVVTYNGTNAVSETDTQAKTSSVTQYDKYGNSIRGSMELATGGNLIRNPGFEEGGKHWTLRGWNDDGKNEIDRTTRVPQLGQTSALRMDTKAINNDWGATIASQKVAVEPNKTYTLSGWVKTNSLVKSGAYFHVIQRDEKGNHLKVNSNYHSKVNGTTDWTKRQILIETSDKTRELEIEAFTDHGNNEGKGTAWFDNFQLEEGSVSSTFNPVPNPSFEYHGDKLEGWHTWHNFPKDHLEDGFGGDTALVIERKSSIEPNVHYRQEIEIQQVIPKDLTITAMSKAQNVVSTTGAEPNNSYAIWVRAQYANGEWREYHAKFPLGTKDWNRSAVVVPTGQLGAIQKLQIHTVFDHVNAGKVWFDDVRVMEGNHLTKTEYDADGNFVTATYDEENRKNTFTYDTYGNQTSATDEKGNKKTNAYNADNQLTKTTLANGTSVSYSYDDNGNTTEKLVTAGGKTQKNIFEYDVDNKLTIFEDALQRKITHQYDVNANKIKTLLPTNGVLEWEYDAANRITKAKRNGKDAFSFGYDENGNETKVTDHINGGTRDKAYDEGNRIVSVSDRGGNVKWSYHPKSYKLKDTVIQHGSYNNTTSYVYDALNQNTKVTDGGRDYHFEYDEFGNTTRYQAGNDTAAQFTYDNTKKLTNLQIGTKDSDRILEESYTYDATSNRTAIERKIGNNVEKTSYAYDPIHQLLQETLPNGTTKSYTYDGFGNRTSVKVVENGKETKSIAATFNEGNQLVKFGNESLTYDANGNRTSDGKYKYTWNETDQLVAITKQGESNAFATYKYDDDNRRIEKSINGKVTRYFYDGDSINPLYETDGSGTVLRQYVYSMDGARLAMKAQGQTLYYHYNPRGDVVAMTDQNREVVATYEYDAWGNVLKSDTKGIAADNPFGYAGYMYDKEIGMYYLIARYYNPEHGVFLSVDPDPGDEDDPITMNGYTYGDNNPVMMVDPDGHLAWFVPLAIHGARIVAPHVGRFVGKQLAKRAVKQTVKYKGKIGTPKRKVVFDQRNLPTQGARKNSITYHIKRGKLYQKRYYDHKGKAWKDIDYTDHDNPKAHPVVPHKHYWNWKKKKPHSAWYPLKKKW
ncbi:DNRLRE domain-containing protein [Bacillus wiedmannii]|uniref:Wall-associated protein n=2 Tax=Bacillus wiedmannii TaxID=1890302 RepID=A0A2B5IM21_9BACI|nr:DNRLRE domain-containing protein [Bacillus wiedmannii]PEM49507.1 wall-associated protein [Bacillus wiedmannii]PFZ26302.1 wall-associated protein [Bacillus wiedmannii]PTC15358.1 wall-associated protein [Bacillus wiedmannii]